jgi:hypothetical protein
VAKASDLLSQFIRDRAHDLASLTVDQPPSDPFSENNPYLLASALQKAARRADIAVARRAGHQLLAPDRSRLWRRVMTVVERKEPQTVHCEKRKIKTESRPTH